MIDSTHVYVYIAMLTVVTCECSNVVNLVLFVCIFQFPAMNIIAFLCYKKVI